MASQITGNSTICSTATHALLTFEWETTGDGFPLQRASNADSIPITWRHRALYLTSNGWHFLDVFKHVWMKEMLRCLFLCSRRCASLNVGLMACHQVYRPQTIIEAIVDLLLVTQVCSWYLNAMAQNNHYSSLLRSKWLWACRSVLLEWKYLKWLIECHFI